MNCWNCGTLLPNTDQRKISFRAACEKCDRDLHCCQNCKYYKPGMSNDCSIPGTDWVSDRMKNNFCEEFSPLGKGPVAKKTNVASRFNDLFK